MALLPILRCWRVDRRCRPGVPVEIARASASIDDAAIAAITDLYREILPAGRRDPRCDVGLGQSLCRRKCPIRRVVGIGAQCAASWQRTRSSTSGGCRISIAIRALPFAAGEFDGAAICAAVQHLTRPGEVIREVGRVLKPGAPLVVTFSNRCRADPADRLLVPARRYRPSLPGRPLFRRSRQLGRYPLPRPHPARRRRAALRGDRPQPRGRPSRQRRLTRTDDQES